MYFSWPGSRCPTVCPMAAHGGPCPRCTSPPPTTVTTTGERQQSPAAEHHFAPARGGHRGDAESGCRGLELSNARRPRALRDPGVRVPDRALPRARLRRAVSLTGARSALAIRDDFAVDVMP